MISFFSLKNKKAFCGQSGARYFLKDIFFGEQLKVTAYIFGEEEEKSITAKRAYSAIVLENDCVTAKNEIETGKQKPFLSCADGLVGAKVHSESGFYFGAVSDVEIETETNSAKNLLVHRHFFEKFFRSPMCISVSYIVAFDDKKIIVQDALLKEFELKSQKAAA